MPPPTDPDLLRRHLARDARAFPHLVEKYTPLVYHAALRQTSNPTLSQEIAQAVFLVLSQKAPTLQKLPTLAPWLLKATRYAAIDALRRENARHRHEHAALRHRANGSACDNAPPNPAADADHWDHILPILDESLAQLSDSDRAILTLRYFQDHTPAAAATLLGISHDAARKRAARALARLRFLLQSRGISTLSALSPPALAHLLTTHAAPATATTLLPSLTPLTILTPLTPHTALLTKNLTTMLAWPNLKFALTTAALLLFTTTTLLLTPRAQATIPPPLASSASPIAPTPPPVAATPRPIADTTTPFNVLAFNQLDDRGRIEYALTMLDHRNQQLRNCSFVVDERREQIKDDTGEREETIRSSFEMRRRDDALWMHLQSSEFKKLEQITQTTASFNGKALRLLANDTHNGRVDEGERTHFLRTVNEMLGLRTIGIIDAVQFQGTLTDLIRRSLDVRADVVVSTVTPDSPLITLSILEAAAPTASQLHTYWLDPARGFMVVRSESSRRTASSKDLGPGWAEVVDSTNVDGVWVPTLVKERSQPLPAPMSLHDEVTYEIKQFQIGKLKETDLDLEFPLGTTVIDSTLLVHYLVLPNGQFQLKDILDERTGVMHYAPPEDIVNSIDPSTPALYTLRAGEFVERSSSMPPEPSQSSPSIIANTTAEPRPSVMFFAFALVLIGAATLILIIKKRSKPRL